MSAPAAEGKPEKKPKAPKKGGGGGGGGGGGAPVRKPKAVNLDTYKKPSFHEERAALFDQLWAKQVEEYQKREKPIKVTLADGKVLDATAWKDSPIDVAKQIFKQSSSLDRFFVAQVNGQIWDLGRVLEDDCTMELLDWEDSEGRSKHVFWHSSAHVLGAAMEYMYGAGLSTGPPQPEEKGGGFFYEADTEGGRTVSEVDYAEIDGIIQKVTQGKHKFQRLVVDKDVALQLFHYNKFKVATLSDKVEDGKTCTVYRCGPLIDPCRGPHVLDTGRIKSIKVHKNSSSYWRNKDSNPVLQRIYGISFPKADMMKEWEERMRVAEELDHRKTGVRQGLWMFDGMSPGSCFWFPKGARIYNKLIEFMRGEYRKRGFDEVITPNMYNKKLWETSGHWAKYSEDMFKVEVDDGAFALKPMNCPGHCLMFGSTRRSYKELPIRFADFGVLHRNELAGALTGLTRVRRFQQDDAHIFCLPSQMVDEIKAALEFDEFVYGVFGFKFHLALSTRPETRIGTPEVWDVAEARLRESLNAFCGIDDMMPDPFHAGEMYKFNGTDACLKKLKRYMEKEEKEGRQHKVRHIWKLNTGDGAFYGPKIDIRVEDATKRLHQLGTVQLDFNLPQRFNLVYEDGSKKDKQQPADALPEDALVTPAGVPFQPSEHNPMISQDGYLKSRCVSGEEAKALMEEKKKTRPVMVHRAILGSLERCVAILAEHWKGRWPFWVSPRQIIVLPISTDNIPYARQVRDRFHGEGYDCDADLSDHTIDKKVREAQQGQYNFILVVGSEEQQADSVNVRTRDTQRHGVKTLAEMSEWFAKLVREKPLDV